MVGWAQERQGRGGRDDDKGETHIQDEATMEGKAKAAVGFVVLCYFPKACEIEIFVNCRSTLCEHKVFWAMKL